eukprot:NODE_1704_length_869_cov_80.793902_g1339_i0.p1 GENE.NODE_1704_length_869_cov_80.793902_g1339_i0~~NODE_1704_length_869_cov_80.793902_g1339_i0.p1  ORF type:complete len:171 (+),score=23.97 NODE_1704_length_869_cov_80.793902_g1339_i0:62-574(+)
MASPPEVQVKSANVGNAGDTKIKEVLYDPHDSPKALKKEMIKQEADNLIAQIHQALVFPENPSGMIRHYFVPCDETNTEENVRKTHGTGTRFGATGFCVASSHAGVHVYLAASGEGTTLMQGWLQDEMHVDEPSTLYFDTFPTSSFCRVDIDGATVQVQGGEDCCACTIM